MKKLFVLSGALLAASLLTGCEEETKSPQWWLDHPKEASEKYQDCKKTGTDSINCRNVNQMAVRIAYKYEPMKKILSEEAEAIKNGK